ncbi:ATP:cob(I)alamin adenosyltransferase [Anaerobacillus arseniciselenatis]|uniref:Corrinoid adenosyltransferase n=1 Tax=Anaerobacillus arseniciselenatis TaxID=85682 RepID=A0A1S2LVC3_9BACI|nr:cob(I)yrinic acid a,c-diamide adenosyltransferase [Anaerobacillus arseniciselenatis]OIJ16296.1 ATP:cob(I)alamin adenosyltransferase [Anaerobacillus arseniciselenatis]
MKLYTKTGDKGKTSVIGGRLDKDHVRVEAYGTVDELNSFVGVAIAELSEELFRDIIKELEKIQHELFDCGGDLAIISKEKNLKANEEMVTFLEERIDAYTDEAPPIQKFILPGGSKASSAIHVCRTVTRRAERLVVQLDKMDQTNQVVLKYLNRLSDYFFAIARVINFRLSVKDVEYERSALVFKDNKTKD